jgi:uncharacterized protein involved in exopolysaccharide biosynthesis
MTPIFRSEGVILIEEGDIPEELVSTTVRGFVEERVELVRKRVFVPEHINEAIAEFSLYVDEDPALSARQKVRKFEDSSAILVEEMMDGTIAFTVSFDDEDPEKAKLVADRLLSLFLAENVKDRTQSASMAAEFLEAEAVRLAEEMAVYEWEIAKFKEEHRGRLPEQVLLNVQLLDRAERELESVNGEIRALEQRRSLIDTEIFRLNNTVGFGGEAPAPGSADRLRYLQAEYMRMLAIYSPQHPDLLRTKREIEMLSPGGSGLSKRYIGEQLRAQEMELADLRSRYSADHPDLIRVERSVNDLRAKYQTAPEEAVADTASQDPELMRLTAERTGIDRELSAQRSRRTELRAKTADYEDRLTSAPELERELLEFTRGYDQLQQKYDDLKLKQTQVELSVSVEQEQRAGRFGILSSPDVASSPVIPNRPAVIFLGLIFGFGLGLSLAAILESADKTIRDEHDIRDAWGGPAIVSIPVIANQADLRLRAVFLTAYFLTISGFILGAALTVIGASA